VLGTARRAGPVAEGARARGTVSTGADADAAGRHRGEVQEGDGGGEEGARGEEKERVVRVEEVRAFWTICNDTKTTFLVTKPRSLRCTSWTARRVVREAGSSRRRV